MIFFFFNNLNVYSQEYVLSNNVICKANKYLFTFILFCQRLTRPYPDILDKKNTPMDCGKCS